MSNMYSQLLEAGLAAGIPMINTDTSARILAVVFVYNHEQMTRGKFAADCMYIAKRFHIEGGETPDRDFSALVRRYAAEAEDYGRTHKAPIQWAQDLCKERYGFKLFW